MQSSFYGGKSGSSFVIVKSFSSVAEMVTNFKRGDAYTEVHFNEHILINTEDKNNPENGRIYRRGYNFTNDIGGAVYIGTIVGPSGRAPMLELTTIENVKSQQNQSGFPDRYSEGSYSVPVSLVPGKDGNEYNDVIEWASCCIRNANNEDSTAYIGFKFPYTVIDFTSQTVSAYYNRSNNTANFVNQNLVSRTDDKTHPFYEKWHINVPKGIKGDAFKNFRVIPANSTIQDYTGREDDIANNRKVLVYDYYHYDKNENGEPVTLYLGDYNMINSIDVSEDGTLTIDYEHDNDLIYTKLFRWIKQVTLDDETGHFKITYNQETDANGRPTTYQTDLNWVKDISFDDKGSVILDYTHDVDKGYTNLIKWIKQISLDKETGHFEIKFNYDQNKDGSPTIYTADLDWVKDITIDNNGDIIFDYTNSADKRYSNLIKWIKQVSLDKETGHFEIKFNYDTDSSGASTIYQTDLDWVKGITFDEAGTVTLDYTKSDNVEYTNLIKWIKQVSLDEKGHLVVKYNYDTDADGNPTIYETDLAWINNVTLAEDGTLTLTWSTGKTQNLQTEIKWITSVSMDPNGTISFNYNNGEREIYEKEIQWITNISLTEDGTFTIKYNNDTPNYTAKLRWVNDVQVIGDGTVTILYNDGQSTVHEKLIKYISSIELLEDGTFTINYNTGESKTFDKKIQWINNISLLEDGTFTIEYNNDISNYETILKWAEDITIDEDGTVRIVYNNGEPTVYNEKLKYIKDLYISEEDKKIHVVYNTSEGDVPIGEPIKFIENIYLDDDETKETRDYRLHVVYNTNGENPVDIPIGESFNHIKETVIDKSDYHYLVYYSNENIRNNIPQDKSRTYNGKSGWLDLGSIKDDSGVLVGLNIPLSAVGGSYDYSVAIQYLNTRFPQGLTGDGSSEENDKKTKGKIVTVGDSNDNKRFYAFDYDTYEWYYLGTFDDGRIWNLVGEETDPGIEIQKEKLVPGGGIWFIVEGEDD